MESTSRTSPAGVFWSSALPRRWHTTICSPPLGRLVRSPGLMELETCSSRSNRVRSAAAPYEHAPAAETSAEERTWQGRVWGYVPYDFRPPTLAPIRNSFWAPSRPEFCTLRVFGVGWAVNFGRVYAILRSLVRPGDESCSTAPSYWTASEVLLRLAFLRISSGVLV